MDKLEKVTPLEELKNELLGMVQMEDLEVLKADHKHIPITDLEDKEQYELTKAQWQKTRNTRLELDRKKKDADARFKSVTSTIKDAYTKEYDSLYQALKPEEDKGRAEMKKVEDAEELKRVQKENEYSDKMFGAGFTKGRFGEWLCLDIVIGESEYLENREYSIDLWVSQAKSALEADAITKAAEAKARQEAEAKAEAERLRLKAEADALLAREAAIAEREAAMLKAEQKPVEQATVETKSGLFIPEAKMHTDDQYYSGAWDNEPASTPQPSQASLEDSIWNDAVLACLQATEHCTTVEEAQSNILILMK